MKRNTTAGLFVLLSVAAFVGCGPYIQSIRHEEDPFDGLSKDTSKDVYLAGDPLGSQTVLNVQRTVTKDGKANYLFRLSYEAGDWLFIESGETLIMLVDGARVGFKGSGSLDRRKVGGILGISEEANYEVSFDELKRVANANEVKVKIQGKTSYVERSFSEYTFANLRNFIAQCSPNGPNPQ